MKGGNLARHLLAFGLGSGNLALIAVRQRHRRAHEEAERIRSARHALLASILGTDRVVNLADRLLKPKVCLRPHRPQLERPQIRSDFERQRPYALQVRQGRRRVHPQGVADVDRLVHRSAQQRLEPDRRGGQRQLGARSRGPKLQHGDVGARRLERGDGSGRHPEAVHPRDLLERPQVVGHEGTHRPRALDVDTRESDVQLQLPHGIGKLRFRHRPGQRGELDPAVALVGPFKWNVHPKRVLRRPAVIDLVVAGAQPVQVVGARAGHRVGPKACGHERGVGD